MRTILRLLSITPVTSATVERSKASLRFVKNVYRSTRALLLLFSHKDISLDYSAIVNIFASRNQRRMHFINPLDDWSSWFRPDIVFKEHNFCLRNSKKKILKMLEIASLTVSIQNCATIPISVTGPLFLNILDPPLNTALRTTCPSLFHKILCTTIDLWLIKYGISVEDSITSYCW